MNEARVNPVWNRSDRGIYLPAALLLAASLAFASPLQAAPADRPLIGASYFAGWWRPLPNKWNYDPAVGDWRARFPQRVPLSGEYNDQPTMDKEIVVAAEHGIDFFLILWYYNGPNNSQEREKNSRFLNEGVKTFVNSPEAHRMNFVIEYCNHQLIPTRSSPNSPGPTAGRMRRTRSLTSPI